MKKITTTIILLATIALNAFAQQELPMFFDSELGLATNDSGVFANKVAYSQDGSKIAVAYSRSKISIWDATTGRIITKLAGHGNESISGIVFSPNGRQLASSAQYDSTMKIWDTTSGELIRSISQSGVEAIAFSPDGSRIVGTYSSAGIRGVKIWNTANGSEIRSLVGHTRHVRSVTYSPDGRQILTASNDGSIRIWDVGNGQTIKTINLNEEGMFFVNAVYSPNGQYIAAYAYDWEVFALKIYNAGNGQEVRSIPARLRSNYLVYSPDGRQLLVNMSDSSRNRIIKVFDPDTGRELRSFNNGDTAVAFSPNGQRILTSVGLGTSERIENMYYGASYATFLDATTGRVTGTIGYGPLNVGAKAYADLQIARFLNDTAAVNRHEAILQFVTGNGYATRAEVEAFYRNNVRAQIAAVVDEEFKGITVPAGTVTYVKDSLANFLTTPNQANFNVLKIIYHSTDGDLKYIQQTYDADMANLRTAQEVGVTNLIEMFQNSARRSQNILNERRRQLRVPNDAPIDWGGFESAYRRILNGLNTNLVSRMR